MPKKLLSISIFMMGMVSFVRAQNPRRPEIDMDKFVQDLFGQQTSDERYDVIYENVFQHYRNPIDLNKATKDDLYELYVLSPMLINNIIKYREINGKFLTVYELQAVPGMDRAIFESLLPFVTVYDEGLQADTRTLWQKVRDEENHYQISRVEYTPELAIGFIPAGQEGAARQPYLGTTPIERARLYSRYLLRRRGDFSVGLTMQNDPGEQITWNPKNQQHGFDFYSGHLAFYNKGIIKLINIGDYQMMIGQGMAMSGGFYIGKGAETVSSVKRSNRGVRPYTGQMEILFLRGAAVTMGVGRWEWTNFYSNRNLDGSINASDSNRVDTYASAINLTGFHRTATEISRKGSLNEQIGGSYLVYTSLNKNLKMGINSIFYQFGVPIQRRPSDYNQFHFEGSQMFHAGFDASYTWQNFSMVGEYSYSKGGGHALMAGILGSVHHKIDVSMLYRRYDPNYVSFYGNSFGELSSVRNEQGMYWGIKYTPMKKLSFAAYFDKFNSPWLTSRSDAPSEGYEYMLRVNFMPTRKISVYAQYRDEHKQLNKSDNETPQDFLVWTNRKNYLINFDYKAEKLLTLKSRIQFTEYHQENQDYAQGVVLFQDVNFDFGKVRLSTRYAVFDAPNFNTRIYVYEKNVLYAFAMPIYYGQGSRYYIMLQYKVNKKLDLWFRVAQFNYRNKDQIGSGLNQIDGNLRTDITVQAKYDF